MIFQPYGIFWFKRRIQPNLPIEESSRGFNPQPKSRYSIRVYYVARSQLIFSLLSQKCCKVLKQKRLEVIRHQTWKMTPNLSFPFRKISRSTCTNNLIGDLNTAAVKNCFDFSFIIKGSSTCCYFPQTDTPSANILTRIIRLFLLCQGRSWFRQTEALASIKKLNLAFSGSWKTEATHQKKNRDNFSLFHFHQETNCTILLKYSLLDILKLLNLGLGKSFLTIIHII